MLDDDDASLSISSRSFARAPREALFVSLPYTTVHTALRLRRTLLCAIQQQQCRHPRSLPLSSLLSLSPLDPLEAPILIGSDLCDGMCTAHYEKRKSSLPLSC
jgi:hypothetical protein